MSNKTYAIRGDLIWSRTPQQLATLPDGYLVCHDGRSVGVFAELPSRFRDIELHDYQGNLIIPGLSDLHVHAPQFAFRGLGMDLELLDWLNSYAFPEEARYSDLAYARIAYEDFVQTFTRGATTRAAIFATIHAPATVLLAELLEASGLITMVGKVNMDRNASPALTEASAQDSLITTENWLAELRERSFSRTTAILTPRFIPSCTDELMNGLGQMQRKYHMPVQSHLSENLAEIAWVRELCPKAANYADAYLKFDLFGGEDCPTIMAHCVYSDPEETPLLKRQGVWVAHCPTSNTDIASGIAPVRRFLDADLNIGLGSDVAGGYSPSMLHVMAEAIKVSKLRWRLLDDSASPLTVAEAFYLATKGGGSFWGKVGSFEEGYELDAVVINDADSRCIPQSNSAAFTVAPLSLEQRLERLIYLAPDSRATAKYVAGVQL